MTSASILALGLLFISTFHNPAKDDEVRYSSMNEQVEVVLTKKPHMIEMENMDELEIELMAMSEVEVDPFEQFPVETVLATGYTAGYESTGKSEGHPLYGITYSGLKVQRDSLSTIAADLSVFPLGTVLYVPDYGYGIVTDIGGAIKGKKIDLYYDTVEEVYREWGKKEVDVYVIEQGDGTVSEADIAYWTEQIENEAVPVVAEE